MPCSFPERIWTQISILKQGFVVILVIFYWQFMIEPFLFFLLWAFVFDYSYCVCNFVSTFKKKWAMSSAVTRQEVVKSTVAIMFWLNPLFLWSHTATIIGIIIINHYGVASGLTGNLPYLLLFSYTNTCHSQALDWASNNLMLANLFDLIIRFNCAGKHKVPRPVLFWDKCGVPIPSPSFHFYSFLPIVRRNTPLFSIVFHFLRLGFSSFSNFLFLLLFIYVCISVINNVSFDIGLDSHNCLPTNRILTRGKSQVKNKTNVQSEFHKGQDGG